MCHCCSDPNYVMRRQVLLHSESVLQCPQLWQMFQFSHIPLPHPVTNSTTKYQPPANNPYLIATQVTSPECHSCFTSPTPPLQQTHVATNQPLTTLVATSTADWTCLMALSVVWPALLYVIHEINFNSFLAYSYFEPWPVFIGLF
jgi:hypothetical protein